jgi:hypothetical protein
LDFFNLWIFSTFGFFQPLDFFMAANSHSLAPTQLVTAQTLLSHWNWVKLNFVCPEGHEFSSGKQSLRKDGTSQGYARFKCTICNKSFGTSSIVTLVNDQLGFELFDDMETPPAPPAMAKRPLSPLETEAEQLHAKKVAFSSAATTRSTSSLVAENLTGDVNVAISNSSLESCPSTTVTGANALSGPEFAVPLTCVEIPTPSSTPLQPTNDAFQFLASAILNMQNSFSGFRQEQKDLLAQIAELQKRLAVLERSSSPVASHSVVTSSYMPASTTDASSSSSFRPPPAASSSSHALADQRGSNASTTTARPSFAEIVAKHQPDRQAGIQALLAATRTNAPPGRAPNRPASRGPLKLLYVNGLNFITLREVRSLLYNARFLMSKIRNVSWIGRSHLEFLIESDYEVYFRQQITDLHVLSILEDFDARVHSKDPSPAALSDAQDRFAARVERILVNTHQEQVRSFFTNYVRQSAPRIQALLADTIRVGSASTGVPAVPAEPAEPALVPETPAPEESAVTETLEDEPDVSHHPDATMNSSQAMNNVGSPPSELELDADSDMDAESVDRSLETDIVVQKIMDDMDASAGTDTTEATTNALASVNV